MLTKRDRKIIIDMLSLPTAPFAEDYVRQYIFDYCLRRDSLRVREDAVGNIIVHYKHPNARVKRPVCLCGHMDHPGFRALRMLDRGLLKAQWHGGVQPSYFRRAAVRFFQDDHWVHGKIKNVSLKTLGLETPVEMVDTVEIELLRPRASKVKPGAPGMWDFPDPQVRGQRIFARACDDIAGCSAILSALDILVRRKVNTEAYFLFTRAEEVGFIGAIAACRRKTIPKKCLVVAIETSSVIPGVSMGAGPILRVGDKSSVFDPDLTAWCGQVANSLATKSNTFSYQRKLMDGGSCESSAYCQFGYQATGICIALGNYHNCDRETKKLAPEYINLSDHANLVKWFVELTTTKIPFGTGQPKLMKRLKQLEKRYERLLMSTS